MEGALRPVGPDERLEVLDVLRGFAIAGIVLVNAKYFALPLFSVLEYRAADDFPGLADRAADWLVLALAEGKLYPLLGLLFGYGFGVQLARSGAGARYARRLVGLLVLGLVHAVLVWAGDVLVAYAVLGAVLATFRRRSDASLLRWAAGLAALHAAVLVAGAAGLLLSAENRGATARAAAAAVEAYGRGDFASAQAARAADAAVLVPLGLLTAGPGFLAMFLLGLWAQRRDVLRRPEEHRALLRRVAIVGLGVGGATSLAHATLWTSSGGRGPLAALGYALGAGGLVHALGYAAGIALLVERGRARVLAAALRPVGRLALSNYLLQSLVATTVFYGYGLGLYGRLGPAALLPLALGIAAAGAVLSALWLRAYRIGPAEWLLRSFTYARPQPLR